MGVPDSLRLISKTARMQIEAPKPQKNGLGMHEWIMINRAREKRANNDNDAVATVDGLISDQRYYKYKYDPNIIAGPVAASLILRKKSALQTINQLSDIGSQKREPMQVD